METQLLATAGTGDTVVIAIMCIVVLTMLVRAKTSTGAPWKQILGFEDPDD